MFDTPLEFALHDGETYLFSPITLKDWSAFCRWCNGRRGKSPDAPLPFDEMMAEAQTLDGMLWLCVRAVSGHHKIERDRLMEAIGTLDRLAEIVGPLISPGEPSANPHRAEEAST